MQAKEVSEKLALRAEEIARKMFPHGKRIGNEFCVGDLEGSSGRSLKIHLKGIKAGIWCDFAMNQSGDLLDLWAEVYKVDIGKAIKQACDYLGIEKQKFEFHEAKKFIKPAQTFTNSLNNARIVNYLIHERKIHLATQEIFNVGQNETEIIFRYFRDNEIVLIKYLGLERINGKKQIRVEPNCEPCLFGWHVIAPDIRQVTICEGEIDAMSLYQYGIPALSVPFGAGGDKQPWIQYEFDRLARFDEIFICMDNDDAGRLGAKGIAERLGAHRCKIVILPLKDANECLQEGLTSDMVKSYFKQARSIDPEELKKLEFFEDATINEIHPVDGLVIGYESPWKKTAGKILFRPSEVSVWGGINGHGKSQFLGQVILGLMNQGAKVCIASLELKPNKLIARLVKQATAMNKPSPDYIKAVLAYYNDNLWLFNLIGNAKSSRLLEVFKYARQCYGVDVFVIDSFMMMDIAEDDYKAQKSFMEKLCEFKNVFDCHVHIVVHPRKGSDELSPPGKMDFKGTGAISDLADNCFTVWRNKAKEQALQKRLQGYGLTNEECEIANKPDCILNCDKQRHGDWEGSFAFWFEGQSYRYLESDGAKVIPYVDFSCLKD